MGLFGKKETCSVCGSNKGSKKLIDGYMCKDCAEKAIPYIMPGAHKNFSVDKAKLAIVASEENKKLATLFQPTKKIDKYISFDENRRLWKSNASLIYFSYEDIIDFELIENAVGKGKTEVNTLEIKITTKKELCPVAYVTFLLTGPVKSGSILHRSYKGYAQQIISELTVITNSLKRSNVQSQAQTTVSSADEILKFKKLFDDGIISAEEFELKKKQLLGL